MKFWNRTQTEMNSDEAKALGQVVASHKEAIETLASQNLELANDLVVLREQLTALSGIIATLTESRVAISPSRR